METLKKLISSGNRKLSKSTAIFNFGAATDCPSLKLGLCQAKDSKTGKVTCYALKAESGLYPGVLPYRRRQETYWKSVTAEQFTNDFKAINARKRKPYKTLRFNESGDFWNQKDVIKAEKIAQLLDDTVRVYTYTARKDLDFSNIKYLVINGSGFKTTGVQNIFQYVEKAEDAPVGGKICNGISCGEKCIRCQIAGNITYIPRH